MRSYIMSQHITITKVQRADLVGVAGDGFML